MFVCVCCLLLLLLVVFVVAAIVDVIEFVLADFVCGV